MDRDEYWEHFITTGSVEDYLLYAGAIGRKDQGDGPKKEEGSRRAAKHAGEHSDFGNHTADGAYRGIR